MMQILGVNVENVGFRRGKWVRWMTPKDHFVKMNVDGSKIGNETTAGGVF